MAAMRRFTYGAQFTNDKTPLTDLLALSVQHESDRWALQEAIRAAYYGTHGAASKTLAGNCILSMNAYRLIALSDGGKTYSLTDLGRELAAVEGPDPIPEVFRRFAVHILVNLDGLFLLRVIENMRARGEQVTVEAIGDELNDLDIELPTNSTYVSTMRGWRARAGVFHASGYDIRWDVVDGLLGVDADTVTHLYRLTGPQKYFLLSMAQIGTVAFTPSNSVAHYARNVFRVKITSKSLVKDVIDPLVLTGLVESRKTTMGRGAKPHEVRLTDKGQAEVLSPLLTGIAKASGLQTIEINRSFEAVVAELDHPDKNIRGVALELLAIWMIRLLGLRFSRWRARNFHETGGSEVDVIAASDKIVYSRWQIQCKNTKNSVDVDTVAKEIGLTFLTRADIVMVVTTVNFTSAAVDYANQVTDISRYYMILLGGEDIAQIVKDRSKIVDILNVKARRVFAKRELGITEFGGQLASTSGSEKENSVPLGLADSTLFIDIN